MIVCNYNIVILLQHAAVDAADADTTDIIVVVNGGDQHLQRRRFISLRGGDVFQDGVEKRSEIRARFIRRIGGGAGAPGAPQHGAVELLIGCVQLQQQLQNLISNLVKACVGLIDFVYDDDHGVVQLQRSLQNKARLRHGALGCIHQQNNAVDHFQNALYLAAEIGMARGVNDIDFGSLIVHGGVFGKDGDASFPLQSVAVHHALFGCLIFPVNAALLQHFVNQRCFAVVDMGDDRNVS